MWKQKSEFKNNNKKEAKSFFCASFNKNKNQKVLEQRELTFRQQKKSDSGTLYGDQKFKKLNACAKLCRVYLVHAKIYFYYSWKKRIKEKSLFKRHQKKEGKFKIKNTKSRKALKIKI